jgi:general secretion pathway protein L
MTEALVIRLLSAATEAGTTQAEWLAVDATGARHGNVQHGSLLDAAQFSGGRRVVLLVPATDVYLAEPVLPLKSGAKLLQIVPFALEEQMATDIDNLHFAVGRRDERPGTPVAAVAHTLVEAWQRVLAEAGMQAEAIYPESSTLPLTPGGVTVIVDGARVYVKRETSPGAVLDVQPLIEALQLALAAGEDAREHVTIYLTEDTYERDRDLFEGLREFTASLQLKLLPDGPLPLLAASAMQGAPINLLQGRYAVRKKLNLSFHPWRYAALLAGVFVLLHFGLAVWQYFDLKRTEAQLDRDIARTFQEAMPGAPVPSPLAARKEVELRLNALRGGGPAGGIMLTLSALGEAFAQAPGVDLEALSYRDNATDVRVLAPTVDSLDKIQHVLGERGISAEIQSANPRGAKIEGRMKFKQSGI